MSNLINIDSIANVIMHGDLSKLSSADKLTYYKNVCDSVGLNPLNQPFQYIKLNGKEVLYAGKGCAEQLRKLHNVSIKITDRQRIDDIYVVTAQASMPNGRVDESTGAVNITGLKGEILANAFLKAETKAKRRATLSIIGLGMLDEVEVASIPNYQKDTRPVSNNAEDIYAGTHVQEHYTIPFGKYKDSTIEEVGVDELKSYIEFLNKKGSNHEKVIEFLDRAEAYIVGLEFEAETKANFSNAMAKDETSDRQSSFTKVPQDAVLSVQWQSGSSSTPSKD